MQLERRAANRSPVHLFFNKYVDGQPHLCEALEISMTGMLVRRIYEPDVARACYAIELADPAQEAASRVWLCASPVWRFDRYEALTFVGQSPLDKMRLADLLSSARAS